MAELQDWNIDPDSAPNTNPPPDGAPELATNFSDLNDIIREHMAVLARWYADTSAPLDTAGTAPTYTLTSTRTITAYESGLTFRIKVHAGATGASTVTINLNSLGAKTLYDMHGAAILSDQLVTGEVMDIVYDGAAWRKISGSAARMGPGHLYRVEEGSAGTRVFTYLDHGKVVYNLSGTVTYEFPASLPTGFMCVLANFAGASSSTVQAAGGANMAWSDGTSGTKVFSGGVGVVIIIKLGTILGSERFLGILAV